MFVLRVIDEGAEKHFRAWSRKPDAQKAYDQLWSRTRDGEFENLALFEVPWTDDAREAVEAVRKANPAIQLLEYVESADKELKKLVDKIDFSSLDL